MTLITRNFRAAMVKALGQRGMTAHEAAQVLASNQEQLARAIAHANPRLKAVIAAFAEVGGLLGEVGGEFDAIDGHAQESAELARSHEHDMANVATLVVNLPELMDAEIRMAPYPIDPADLGTIQAAVNLISYEIQLAAQSTHQGKPFRVGVVIKAAE